MTVSFEGTDGATGPGASFVRSSNSGGISMHVRLLERPGRANAERMFELHGTRALTKLGDVCATIGAELTTWRTGLANGWSAPYPSAEQLPGWYNRYAVPVGVSAGHSFNVWRGLSISPFLGAHISHVIERFERTPSLQPTPDPRRQRTTNFESSFGATLATSWFVSRWRVGIPYPAKEPIVGDADAVYITAQFGVRY